LEQYEQAFRDNDIDARVLPGLTADDLKEIGVVSVGHRRLMLQAIAALQAAAAPAAPVTGAGTAVVAPAAPAPPQAERRQLTVMFADLVGSTALSARLDPEELQEVLRAYQDAAAGAIARFEGHVAKFMGDGVLAYFGWPQAHEDDAERAARAALALLDCVGRLRTPAGEPLAARVGIATGLVVVGGLLGEGAAREETVVGETPNLAARLQAVAAPGWVVVAEGTRRLLGAAFELETLDPRPLKGLGEAVRASRVLAERPVRSRFEARQTGAVLPLVGREPELALLLERWRLAQAGQGQAVLISGEPGLGKSRLAEALADALAGEPHAVIRYRCSPQHAESSLWPVTEQLGLAAGFAPGDYDAARLGKLEALLRPGAGDAAEAAALLAPLLGMEPAGRHPVLDSLTPRQRRARTLAALADHLLGLAVGQPALILFEDVHWVDPTTLELVEQVLERIAGSRVLVLLTSRPEGQPRLGDSPRLMRLALERLGHEASSAIVRKVGRGKPLPPDLEEAIARRTDGVPLFVEELTKAVLETGQFRETDGGWVLEGVLPVDAIPSSLQASLLARLDRLAPAKQVAQVAACIGREFDHALLAAVMPLAASELDAALERLVASELVSPRGGPADGVAYAFKHALVQDAAYASMLKSRRQQVHAAIAIALEKGFPEIAATQPEIVARHCELAGRMERAAEYWQRAGELAIGRSATAEAAAHLGQAVRCLAALPPSRERRTRELELQAKLGPALIHVKGYAAPETGQAWARARELCRELGLSDGIGPVLFGQYVFHYVRAEFEPAREAARELLGYGRERGDPAARLVGTRNLGVVCLSTGEFAEGRRHLEAALEGLPRLDERSLTLAYGQDLRTTGLLWLAKVLLEGFPERALVAGEEGLRRSEALGHPNTRAFTLCHAAKLTALTRDARGTVPLADATVEFAAEQGYAQWLAEAWTFRGWARAELGEPEAGLAELGRGARAYRASGAVHWRGTHLGLRGRVLALQGRLDEARDVLGEALAHARGTGERWFEAELERLTGEVLARGGRVEEAEASFSRALGIARSQGARMWELRAATCLARVRFERGEPRKAHELLAPVYDWFTEGFDTPDLQEAKALLQELASAPLSPRARPRRQPAAPVNNPG
jgi:class 3 adenylate cyclase/predicted ATPase